MRPSNGQNGKEKCLLFVIFEEIIEKTQLFLKKESQEKKS